MRSFLFPSKSERKTSRPCCGGRNVFHGSPKSDFREFSRILNKFSCRKNSITNARLDKITMTFIAADIANSRSWRIEERLFYHRSKPENTFAERLGVNRKRAALFGHILLSQPFVSFNNELKLNNAHTHTPLATSGMRDRVARRLIAYEISDFFYCKHMGSVVTCAPRSRFDNSLIAFCVCSFSVNRNSAAQRRMEMLHSQRASRKNR